MRGCNYILVILLYYTYSSCNVVSCNLDDDIKSNKIFQTNEFHVTSPSKTFLTVIFNVTYFISFQLVLLKVTEI